MENIYKRKIKEYAERINAVQGKSCSIFSCEFSYNALISFPNYGRKRISKRKKVKPCASSSTPFDLNSNASKKRNKLK